MKKIALSIAEKKLLRAVLLLFIIQILIVCAFARLIGNAHPVSINDVKQIDITIDEVYEPRVLGKYYLLVISDSEKYLFYPRHSFEEASPSVIYRSVSKGDPISLMCYESSSFLFGKVNVVVDARTDTEIFRSVEEYNKSMQESPIVTILLFSVLELIFLGGVIIYVWVKFSTFKSFYKKAKKCCLRN